MDKQTVKTTLSAFRAGTGDAHDPSFAEALREAEGDPELAAWFADAQRFDALMIEKLNAAPAPTRLPQRFEPRRRLPAAWLAAAALIVAAFFVGRGYRPTAPTAPSDGSLALQAIAYTGRMPALQFVCFDAGEVQKWIDRKSAAMHMGQVIEKPMPNMRMIGSSAAEWGGKPVLMIALQNGDRMAMLYLLRAADFPGAAAEVGQVMEMDGWASKTGRRGDHIFVLTARGASADLDFPMPL